MGTVQPSLHIHEPAKAVASVSPIPICVLKHCGAHIHKKLYIYACDQNNLRIPKLVGFTHQLGCDKWNIPWVILFMRCCVILHNQPEMF